MAIKQKNVPDRHAFKYRVSFFKPELEELPNGMNTNKLKLIGKRYCAFYNATSYYKSQVEGYMSTTDMFLITKTQYNDFINPLMELKSTDDTFIYKLIFKNTEWKLVGVEFDNADTPDGYHVLHIRRKDNQA